jgi:hypothetical protein
VTQNDGGIGRASYGDACAGVKRSRTFALVNPLLALALVLAAGLAVTRLPLPHLRHSLSLDLVLAAGAPLVLVGLLLGPGLGVLDRGTLRALAPVAALGIGWIGAVFGAQLEWRLLRRIPRRAWALAALQAAAMLLLTAVTAWWLTRSVPALAAAWHPKRPALLTIAAAAMISGPGAVALVARAAGLRPSRARALGRAAMLDTMFGALVFMLALGLYHPRQSFAVGGAVLGWAHWVAVAVAASGGAGVLFLWLSRLRTDTRGLGVDLLGVTLLGSGIGYAADLSPFVVCALATGLIVNLSPLKRRVQALLLGWEHPIYAIFLIVAGALLDFPSAWILAAALLLGVVRVATRWAAVRYGRTWLQLRDLPPHVGLATVAQGGVALAVALSFNLIYAGSGTILTTVLLGVALAQAIAGPLMALALRPAPPEVS